MSLRFPRARAVVLAGALGLCAVGWIVQACSSDGGGGTDAGSEAGDAAQEAAVDAGCDLSSNLLDQIPDAEIADGATTSGACIACLNAQCATQVSQCNQLCACKNAAAKGLDCYLKNPSAATACLVSFTGVDLKVQSIAFGLLGCVQSKCKAGCATEAFNPDAAPPDQDGGE